MHAFLLAAGAGSRMRAISEYVPKALLHVRARPVIRILVEELLEQGFRQEQIVICANAREEERFIHEFRDLPRLRWMSSARPLGTAGEIQRERIIEFVGKQALKHYILVIYADDLTETDYRDMERFHKELGGAATLACTSKVPLDYGLVYNDPDTSRITKFHEKPFMSDLKQLCWTGRAIINTDMVGSFKKGKDLAKHVFPQWLKRGLSMYVYRTNSLWLDVGSASHMRRAQELYGKEH